MRITTICTVISLLATPLAIIAAPAPAPAALANPDPHFKHHPHKQGGAKKEEGEGLPAASGTLGGFGPSRTGGFEPLESSGFSVQQGSVQKKKEGAAGGNGPAGPTPTGGSESGNGGLDEHQTEQSTDDSQGSYGDSATATDSSSTAEKTG
ncbi:MAG: hypothetical protein Q9168_007179 [Polycauliona sp. 1 TL-2023]